MRRRLTVLALLAALAACESGGPFIYMDPTVTMSKVPDQIRRNGFFTVCYGDGEEAKADALATATCADYNLVPRRSIAQRNQCSLTDPDQVVYYCVNPGMRMANGTYINPLSKAAVKAWQEQQERLKAYEATLGGRVPAPAPGAAAPAAAPPPAADFAPPVGGWGPAWDSAGRR